MAEKKSYNSYKDVHINYVLISLRQIGLDPPNIHSYTQIPPDLAFHLRDKFKVEPLFTNDKKLHRQWVFRTFKKYFNRSIDEMLLMPNTAPINQELSETTASNSLYLDAIHGAVAERSYFDVSKAMRAAKSAAKPSAKHVVNNIVQPFAPDSTLSLIDFTDDSHNANEYELSGVFAPEWHSTQIELIVDRSHFDVSMFKMCRSLSASHFEPITKKTTTIVPVINTNQSSQPLRTVVRTATPVGAHSFAEFGDSQTIRTQFASKEQLKQYIDSSLTQTMFSESAVVVDGQQTLLSAKHKVLLLCDPNEVIDFEDVFEPKVLQTCRKIGEGSYGEVFMAKDKTDRDIVIKVIALINNGDQEEEELFSQILPEIVINKELSKLKTGLTSNRAPNYVDIFSVTATRGLFPQKLMDEWNAFDDKKGSESEDPKNYTEDQLYVVLQLANGGTDLESFQFTSSIQTISIFGQLALSLAAAEMAYEFEHRDMHWGNVLVSMADVSHLQYCVNGQNYSLRANGVFASLIDFSLSRMSSDGFIIYDDLEKDSDLFEGREDYQFDIFRYMRTHNETNWEEFNPHTNILWLDYILDKIITKKWTKFDKNIKSLSYMKEFIRAFKSSSHLVRSVQFSQLLSILNGDQSPRI